MSDTLGGDCPLYECSGPCRHTQEEVDAAVPGREATCRHCGGEVTPQRFSTTGWMHSTGIIVCPGQQHYLMSAVRKAAEPSASARETT